MPNVHLASSPAGNAKGFSLIEVMVAMVIGMLTVLVIMQTLAGAEAQRRRTTGGGDAQTNGALGLHVVERDLRVAGFGLTIDNDILDICSGAGQVVRGYNATRTPPDIVFSADMFAPLVINPTGIPAGDANTDVLQVTYSGSLNFVGTGVNIDSPSAASAVYSVQPPATRAGFHTGDLALAVENGKDCIISQVTGLPNGAGVPDECGQPGGGTDKNVIHNTGTFKNFAKGCGNDTAVWNKAGGLGVDFDAATGAKLYSLGPPDQMISRIYAVRNGNLSVCNVLQQDCTDLTQWAPLAEGIVSLRAEYGRDADNSGVIAANEWSQTKPVGAAQWRQVFAVRLAMVARSREFERDPVSTDSSPPWLGDGSVAPVTIDLTSAPDGANWANYRYRVFQTVVPLRNVMWGNNV